MCNPTAMSTIATPAMIDDRPDRGDERNDDEAGERGAGEVGEVQPVDVVGTAGEQRGDAHPDRQEADVQPEADQQELTDGDELDRGVARPDRQRVERGDGDGDEADDHADRGGERAPGEEGACRHASAGGATRR